MMKLETPSLDKMRPYDATLDEPATGWDRIAIEKALEDNHSLYVDDATNEIWEEVWLLKKREAFYLARLRKDET